MMKVAAVVEPGRSVIDDKPTRGVDMQGALSGRGTAIDWSVLEASAAATEFGVDLETGLTAQEAARRFVNESVAQYFAGGGRLAACMQECRIFERRGKSEVSGPQFQRRPALVSCRTACPFCRRPIAGDCELADRIAMLRLSLEQAGVGLGCPIGGRALGRGA